MVKAKQKLENKIKAEPSLGLCKVDVAILQMRDLLLFHVQKLFVFENLDRMFYHWLYLYYAWVFLHFYLLKGPFLFLLLFYFLFHQNCFFFCLFLCCLLLLFVNDNFSSKGLEDTFNSAIFHQFFLMEGSALKTVSRSDVGAHHFMNFQNSSFLVRQLKEVMLFLYKLKIACLFREIPVTVLTIFS